MIKSGYWQEFTTSELMGLDPEHTVGLLPLGAIEQHGPHLPLATDALIAEALARSTLERVQHGLLVLPPMSVGHSLEHIDFEGTLSISAEALLASWLDLGRSVARAGLRKLILLNTHGGNIPVVQLAALRLRQELGMFVVRANYFSLGSPPGLFVEEELRHGIHGGEMETSLMLHLRPDLVRRSALMDFRALTHDMAQRGGLIGPEKPIGFGWMSQDLNEHGVCGNAERATAERGALLFAFLADKVASLVSECQSLPLSTLRSRPAS
jgi:creatinine amidohydrolase